MLHIIVKFNFSFMEEIKLKLNERQQDVIRKVMGEHDLSNDQKVLVKFVLHDYRNAIVQAVAGSGKSKTIELLTKLIDPSKKVLIIAFNKEVADKMEFKFLMGDHDNIKISTYHKFGFEILKRYFGWREEYEADKINKAHVEHIDRDKYAHYLFENINSLSGLASGPSDQFRKNVLKLIDCARVNKSQTEKEIKKDALKYNVRCIDDECKVAAKALEWGKQPENMDKVDFTDMLWLPYELHLPASRSTCDQYDFVFIDEAQDSSPIQQELLKFAMKRGTRFFAFGDREQTINGWCGADIAAFNTFGKKVDTTSLNLSSSFRCPKSVERLVKNERVNPKFSVVENNIEGKVNYLTSIDDIKEGDLVLCRKTVPLVDLQMKLLDQGKSARVLGLNFIDKLRRIIKGEQERGRNGKNPLDNSMAKDDFIRLLFKRYIFEQLKKRKDETGFSYREIFSDETVAMLYDAILAIRLFAKEEKTVGELSKKMDDLFGPDLHENDRRNMSLAKRKELYEKEKEVEKKAITLSTVHRAKGKEFDNVFILCNSILSSPMAKTEWEKEEEKNVVYVAYTRAIKTLNFVDEKEIPCPQYWADREARWMGMLEMAQEYGITFNEETGEILEEK